MTANPVPTPAITVDGSGLLCVRLLLRLRDRIAGATPGTIVHVITTDPAAPLDLPAWCDLTGHTYLGTIPGDAEASIHALQVVDRPRLTRPDRPWHPIST